MFIMDGGFQGLLISLTFPKRLSSSQGVKIPHIDFRAGGNEDEKKEPNIKVSPSMEEVISIHFHGCMEKFHLGTGILQD